MGTLNNTNLSLFDLLKRMDPDSAYATIVELLEKQTPEMEDATWFEGNLPTGDVFTSRVGLPQVNRFRRFNEGFDPDKSKTAQITETCGILPGRSVIDCSLAEVGGNPKEARASEDLAFSESFTQGFGRSLFYASSATDPAAVQGLSPRLDSLSGTWGKQVVSASAAPAGNNNASIWGVVWGERAVSGIVPKGSKVGLNAIDMGRQYVDDRNGKKFLAWVTEWEWKFGFRVKDGRRLVRIANIDTANLAMDADTLFPLVTKAYYRLHNPTVGGRLVWYCNRTIAEYLDHQARTAVKGGGQLRYVEVDGRPVLMLRGAPVRVTDSLIDGEAAVV